MDYTIIFFIMILFVGHLSGFSYYDPMNPWPRNLRAVPVDGRYRDPLVKVPWITNHLYSQNDMDQIRSAANIISEGTKGCIRFERRFKNDPIPEGETKAAINLFKTDPKDGRARGVCLTAPGYNREGQTMIVFRGEQDPKLGCLQNQRDTVRLLMNSLGIANEYQRSDRNNSLTFLPNYIDHIATSLREENRRQAIIDIYPNMTFYEEFDISSVTMVSPFRFAASLNQPIFLVKKGQVPTLPALSEGDCEGLKFMYGCDITCGDTPTTTATTTAPPCSSLQEFCKTAPSESGYLLGPYEFYQTLVLYNGACALEYEVDLATDRLKPIKGPILLTSYLPAPAGSTAPNPVKLAYHQLTPITNILTYNINDASGKTLTCITNGGSSTVPDALQCLTDAAISNISVTGNSKVSSVSSQISLGDYSIFQYGVIAPANTEVGLFSSDFQTLYQQTTNFLSGQSKIEKITAIQIIQDIQQVPSPWKLGVFGVGSDGVTPYFGYATIPLDASNQVPLTSSWPTQPVPLNQAIVGC